MIVISLSFSLVAVAPSLLIEDNDGMVEVDEWENGRVGGSVEGMQTGRICGFKYEEQKFKFNAGDVFMGLGTRYSCLRREFKFEKKGACARRVLFMP